MSTRFRYFPWDNGLKSLGLYLCDVGWQQTTLGTSYPLRNHPDGYYYTWETGRRLSEYQLCLIFSGNGIVEFAPKRPIQLSSGSLLLFEPGQWHRCKPNAKTGWGTLWIGFNGKFAPALVRRIFAPGDRNIRTITKAREFKYAAMRFIAHALKYGESGPLSTAGELLNLMGNLAEGGFDKASAPDSSSILRRAQSIIAQRCVETINYQALAESLGFSYDGFRRAFTVATGFSPLQFQLSERLRTAKNLIANTDLPISEIARRTGFSSAAYFTRFFKKETQMPPAEYRQAQSTRTGEE